MTRYEYAAIISLALENGAFVNRDMARLLTEFEPEIELIRADTIKKGRDGNPVIERVRVNKTEK